MNYTLEQIWVSKAIIIIISLKCETIFPGFYLLKCFLLEVEAASRKKIPSQALISARNTTIATSNS